MINIGGKWLYSISSIYQSVKDGDDDNTTDSERSVFVVLISKKGDP